MANLEETFKKINNFPNGEQVAKRMAQLWNIALDPDEPASESAQRVIEVIGGYEERLLQRSSLEIFRDKPVLPDFQDALRNSGDEEWQTFKDQHNIEPLSKEDKKRLFVDASGLVKGTDFEKWVLGGERKLDTTTDEERFRKV